MKTLRRCIIEAIQSKTPDRDSQAAARGIQALAHIRILELVDKVIEEAAAARVSAPGALEIREWCLHALDTLAVDTSPALNIQPDPIKDAMADTVLAARLGTADAHALALARETTIREAARDAARAAMNRAKDALGAVA